MVAGVHRRSLMALRMLLLGFLLMLGCGLARNLGDDQQPSFDQKYAVTWGGDHVLYLDGGREIQLSMDKASGSGFGSKLKYSSGFFHFKIKLPRGDSAGVVTAFYLSSGTNKNDELDFEFLGNRVGKPITLQTNIFANGHGNREQRLHLWFDPTADFHEYRILWNPYQIVFFVDNIPIRIFRNKTSAGVDYPSQPMQIIVSLWNGEDWATDGGKAKINWSQAPFIADFKDFNVDGCTSASSSNAPCSSDKFWWNVGSFRELTPAQKTTYELMKAKYMTYDYCTDRPRFPMLPPECPK